MTAELKFKKERDLVLAAAKKGIESNVPLSGLQKKYLKNLLLFSLMNASANETVTKPNFVKLVNRFYKKLIIDIIKEEDDDDDGEFDTALSVDLNKIMADADKLDLQEIQALLTPANIVGIIKKNTNGMSQQQIIKNILALRDAKANHRETPEEAKERERRQKEYKMMRQRQMMMDSRILTRGERSRH